MTNTLTSFTKKAIRFWHGVVGPIEQNTRRTAEATERIDSTRGRGADSIRVEGDPDGEPLPVTLADAGDNSITSGQLPADLGPGGGMSVEGVADGIPVEVRGEVDQGRPGTRPWPVDASGTLQTVAILGPVTVAGSVLTVPAAKVDDPTATANQFPPELGPGGGQMIEGAPDGLPVNIIGNVLSRPDQPIPAGYATGKLAAASVTASFVLVVALPAQARHMMLSNGTDQRIAYSFGGITTHGYAAAFQVLDFPFALLGITETRDVYVKHDGTAPAAEAVTVNVLT